MHPTARHAVVSLAAALACCAGCATLQAPKWPWKKPEPAAADGSTVISSEISPERELGWDTFKAENIKRNWMKATGRGPDEQIAKRALADGDDLFRQGRYRDALKKYQVAIDRWPDSAPAPG